MSSVLKLVIGLLLAVVAAGINWIYLASQTSPASYVAAKSSLRQGQTIESEDLVAVPIPGDSSRVRKSLIPYANRSILLGTAATRDYETGDMILAQDMSVPASKQNWDVIGPFELISVGERFKQPTGSQLQATGSMQDNSVTIAVDAGFDEQTSRLLQAIATGIERDADTPKPEIVAVQVLPSNSRTRQIRNPAGRQPTLPPTSTTVPLRSDVVYQTVSLDGIPNVPVVLLEGDLIRFVVPRVPGT
ncbi:MAG: hypothetical protein AAGA03_03065 [Planctomycetota bacterium]